MYDFFIVGAGYAGAVCARRIAEETGRSILLIDRRPHIAGNMYDSPNEDGILTHWYGPHISVMNEKHAFEFLSRFTDWRSYHHRVNALIDEVEVPLPINFTSIDLLFSVDRAMQIKNALSEEYGFGTNIAILDMRNSSNSLIQEFAEFVFEKVFLHYTMKMWGLRPEEISPSVTGRIPVRLSYDNRHFLHTYQVMPSKGYTEIFKKMLDHPSIDVRLNTAAADLLTLSPKGPDVFLEGDPFAGKIIYTGALDELFQFSEGALPYRSLEYKFITYPKDYVQDTAVLNWPDSRPETRRTEMKRLTGQKKEGITSVIVERPGAYVRGSKEFGEPIYPISSPDCQALYEKYKARLAQYPQITSVGRLAEYRYYNMEAVVLQALKISDEMIRDISQ